MSWPDEVVRPCLGEGGEPEGRLLVKDDTEERIVNVKSTVVMNKAKFPEFVHEEIYACASGANHLRQHVLGYFGEHLLRAVYHAITGQQEESTRQAFLAGVEKLVDQVLFDADVACEDVRNEAIGKRMFLMEHAKHLTFSNG